MTFNAFGGTVNLAQLQLYKTSNAIDRLNTPTVVDNQH